MSWRFWPLTPLSQGARAIQSNRSNTPCLRDLESMLDAFKFWKRHYENVAKEKRERCAKLELIQDGEAYWVKRQRDSAEEDAAKCAVGIRALEWAISELRTR